MQVEGSLSYPFVRKAFALAFVQHLVAETFPCHVVTRFVELPFVSVLTLYITTLFKHINCMFFLFALQVEGWWESL